MSTGDEERLTLLGAVVNGQDRFSFASAQRRSSRSGLDRNCAHGAEHRSSIEREMVGASLAVAGWARSAHSNAQRQRFAYKHG